MARKKQELSDKMVSQQELPQEKAPMAIELLTYTVLPMRNIVIFPGVMIEVFVARASSVQALKTLLSDENPVAVVVAQKDIAVEAPQSQDLYTIGTLVRIVRYMELPDGTFKLLLSGEARFKIEKWLPIKNAIKKGEPNIAPVPSSDETKQSVEHSSIEHSIEIGTLETAAPDNGEDDILSKLSPESSGLFFNAQGVILESASDVDESLQQYYRKSLNEEVKAFNSVVSFLPEEALSKILQSESLSTLLDNIAFAWLFPLSDKQKVLEILSLQARYETVLYLLEREIKNFTIAKNLHQKTRQKIEKTQQNYFLHEQLKAIQKELGDENDEALSEYSDLKKKIAKAKLSKAAKEKIQEEFKKLQTMPAMMPEAAGLRAYIEYLLELPWQKSSKISTDIAKARKILDAEHFGLKAVKETILEFISVYARTKNLGRAILCFVGPPGVGKTSVAASIAKAMNREYQRIALGGLHDEAEIRGHRRTYIGALPGKIIQRIKLSGVKNPMILLDEIDKLSQDFRGDPASALLEVLDPEQNRYFSDNYVEVPFDLSEVLFICTANSLNIPEALRDRMEIIELSGYIDSEKMSIAQQYLIPKQFRLNGIKEDEIEFTQAAIQYIIYHYTMEAGARSLERYIAKICRKTLIQNIENTSLKNTKNKKSKKITKEIITPEKVRDYLGLEKYNREGEHRHIDRVGEVNGLAWTAYGGSILKIQVSVLPGRGEIIKTGSLGAVMQESIQSSMSVVRKQLALIGFPANTLRRYDIHIHLPDNATPKDGPSAGAGLATAMLSAFLQTPVLGVAAVTGEISLMGEVLPIGGLKEKLYAALRDGIKIVAIPKGNRNDLMEVSEEIKSQLEIHLVENIYEVWKVLFVRSISLLPNDLSQISGEKKVSYLPTLPPPKA